jgi:hypothetical protein
MYLRWRYLGPSWTGPATRSTRRFIDRLLAEGECRWRLQVVESKRDGPDKSPREHVLVDLGVIEETALNPNRIPKQVAFDYRNALVGRFSSQCTTAHAQGIITTDQHERIKRMIKQAFPSVEPPPGASYVIIPPDVRERGRQRAKRDAASMRKTFQSHMEELRAKVSKHPDLYSFMHQFMGGRMEEARKRRSASKPDSATHPEK